MNTFWVTASSRSDVNTKDYGVTLGRNRFLYELLTRDKSSCCVSFTPRSEDGFDEKLFMDRLRTVELVAWWLGHQMNRPCRLRKMSIRFVLKYMLDEHCAVLLEGVGMNRTLVELDLSCNSIGAATLHQLAFATAHHPTLRKLMLGRVFDAFRSRTLANHDISEGFRCFIEALCNNQTLQSLDLSSNHLSDVGATMVGALLAKNRGLRELDLHLNGIGRDGAMALAKGLRANKSLRKIDVSHNFMGDSVAFAALTSNHPTLSVVKCRNLGGEREAGSLRLRTAFSDSRSVIKVLDLSKNALTDVGMEHLSIGLANNKFLRDLNLSRCFVPSDVGLIFYSKPTCNGSTSGNSCMSTFSKVSMAQRCLVHLAKALHKNTNLERLVLRNNWIQSVVELGQALKVNMCLTDLDLSHNRIIQLGEILNADTALTKLDLSHNKLGLRGVLKSLPRHAAVLGENLVSQPSAILCKALRFCHLTHINLDNVGLNCQVVTVLLESLIHNRSILSLNLSRNDVGGLENAEALRAMLLRNKTLTELVVQQCRIIDDQGCIGQGLAGNSSLKTLNLCHNGIGDAGAIALAEGLESNSTLQQLMLLSTKFGPTGIARIAKALLVNSSLVRLGLRPRQWEALASLLSDGCGHDWEEATAMLLRALKYNHRVNVEVSEIETDLQPIEFYSLLNKERVWDLIGDSSCNTIWPIVLSNAWIGRKFRLDLFFLILSNRPEICLAASASSTSKPSSTLKRKRIDWDENRDCELLEREETVVFGQSFPRLKRT